LIRSDTFSVEFVAREGLLLLSRRRVVSAIDHRLRARVIELSDHALLGPVG
jgi:hypothetical protein